MTLHSPDRQNADARGVKNRVQRPDLEPEQKIEFGPKRGPAYGPAERPELGPNRRAELGSELRSKLRPALEQHERLDSRLTTFVAKLGPGFLFGFVFPCVHLNNGHRYVERSPAT